MAPERSGTQFSPALVDVMMAEAPTLFDDLERVTSWDAVIAAEPGLARVLGEELSTRHSRRSGTSSTCRRSRSAIPAAWRPRRLCRGRVAARRERRRARTPCRTGARPRPARRVQRRLGQGGRADRGRSRSRASSPAPLRDRADARGLAGPGALGATAVQHHERIPGRSGARCCWLACGGPYSQTRSEPRWPAWTPMCARTPRQAPGALTDAMLPRRACTSDFM